MRIIISPAKKMKVDTDMIPWKSLPHFIEKAEILYSKLQSMSYQQLKELWKCNDAIASQNLERLKNYNLRTNLTPALLAYEGIQYQHMAPGVFTKEEFDYIQEHLRILSGLYGILQPFDGVVPYRLEMQAKFDICDGKGLYSYWNQTIAEQLFKETDCVINLASKEYSLCVSRYIRPEIKLIDCVFGEKKDGKILEKGTLCKMARGEMVRYLAEVNGENPEILKGFSRLGYVFSVEHSNPTRYVFLREEKG